MATTRRAYKMALENVGLFPKANSAGIITSKGLLNCYFLKKSEIVTYPDISFW
jgi:hypothetical protein